MIRTRLLITSLLLTFIAPVVCGQSNESENYFRSPLDIPLYLSGNFGELRSTHFHAGLDFKTQAVIGKNIYAVADGYVSRIKVQSGGYGRALYISHPNGLTTVYAHLYEYQGDIGKFVKDYQYRNQTHQFNLYLKKDQLPVKKGQVIALSGNSGSSGGPHLHFEIRETATQRPRNGLLYNFDVRDNIHPSIRGVTLYPIGGESRVNGKQKKLIYNANGSNGKYALTVKAPISVTGKVGFGIEAYDYLNGSSNRCGIYSIEMVIDSVTAYHHVVEEIGFDEAGFVKSHVDYAERIASGRRFQKMQLDPSNDLGIYLKKPANGYYTFSDDKTHHVQFKVTDSYGNLSTLSFYVKGIAEDAGSDANTDELSGELMAWNKENFFETKDVRVYIPQEALFEDIHFQYEKTEGNQSPYSPVHHIHNRYTPLNRYMKIYVKSELPQHLHNKALLVRLNENGSTGSIGGTYEYGYVVGTTKYFGRYYVDIDTIAPRIVPLNISTNTNMKSQSSIRLKITDNLAGIRSYNGYIDNKWVLFEFDPKNNLIQYKFDDERFEATGGKHDLELFVMDSKGNLSTYTTTFYY